MPRFGAEGIPNALKELMWRQELDNLMFNELPLTEHGGIEDRLNRSMGRRRNEYARRQYGSPGAVDEIRPGARFDDSKTEAQKSRDSRAMQESYLYSKPDALNPLHYNNPPSSIDMEAMIGNSPPGTRPMNRAYNEMPPNIQRYPGMVMPPPDESMQMDQLMQFYTDEGV
jgi:hypothetical protein